MAATAQEVLKIQLNFNSDIITRNIEGISDEESRIFHKNGANPMTWILGHLILVRNSMIAILGGNVVWNDDEFSIYKRGENPENHRNSFKDFHELENYFHRSSTELNRIFSSLEDLNTDNLSDLSALMLHEIYHAGQLGYVRRMIKSEGAIK